MNCNLWVPEDVTHRTFGMQIGRTPHYFTVGACSASEYQTLLFVFGNPSLILTGIHGYSMDTILDFHDVPAAMWFYECLLSF